MDEKSQLDCRHGIAEKSRLFGMCYLMEERTEQSLRIREEVELMRRMGVKSVRQWMHFSHFMSDPETVKRGRTLDNMHELLAECERAGMMNIGMNCTNFSRARGVSWAKPYARDLSADSEYVNWLNDYYISWKTLVQEFPEVKYWEVDNEVNNPDFMTDGISGRGKTPYSVEQMAEIAADMFYYATRAIHETNPGAKSVMGGLTEPTGLGNGNTAEFLQILYDKIASGRYGYFYGKESEKAASADPDDYFDIACWHPYMSDFDRRRFLEINNSYYEIILRNEGKHKKVFFTELGWNDEQIGGESVSMDYMRQTFEAVKELPYVETVNLFKLYDDGTLNNWDGPGFLYFGQVHDAAPEHVYTPIAGDRNAINIDDRGRCIPGAPKRRAYLFQELAGGKGDLNLLVSHETQKENDT